MTNQTHSSQEPSSSTSSTLTLRAAKSGPSRGPKVLFIAASALSLAAMPGVADQFLDALGSAISSTAHAGEPNECGPQVYQGYEQQVIEALQKYGVELPKGIEEHVSLFELSDLHDATVIRERNVTILVTGGGKVLPAPKGIYVFPDGIVTEINDKGLIGKRWGLDPSPYSYWAMCRTDTGWENCT